MRERDKTSASADSCSVTECPEIPEGHTCSECGQLGWHASGCLNRVDENIRVWVKARDVLSDECLRLRAELMRVVTEMNALERLREQCEQRARYAEAALRTILGSPGITLDGAQAIAQNYFDGLSACERIVSNATDNHLPERDRHA